MMTTRKSLGTCAIGAAGCLLLLAARTPTLLLLFGAVLGVGIGLFLTANWALANALAPAAAAGKFLGLTNLATAGAGAVGRLQGPMIDLLNNARPGAFIRKMGEREMTGYVGVAPADTADPDELKRWVTFGLDYTRTLPPK